MKKARKSLGPAIRAVLERTAPIRKKKRKEQRKAKSLKEAKPFNHILRLIGKDDILEKLFESIPKDTKIKEIDKAKDALNALLANIIYNKPRKTKIYLDSKRYIKNQYHNTPRYITKLVHKLYAKRYLDMEKGYPHRMKRKLSHRTRIWATEKLIQLLNPLPDTITSIDSKELVELNSRFERDHNTGKILKDKNGKRNIFYKRDKNGKINKNKFNKRRFQYKCTSYDRQPFTQLLRDDLRKINKVNKSADITSFVDGKTIKLHVELKAVFTEDFSHGGRLYTTGYYHYQQYSGKKRKQFLINREPVVELDFSQYHPRLLYALEKIQYPAKGDPYELPDVHYKNEEAKKFLKIMLLMMLNNKNFNLAQKACNYWLLENPEYYDILGIKSARPIMEKFLEFHKPIQKYLCNGAYGIKLQKLDGKIAREICLQFANEEIPILPVHDSFIVQKQYKDKLEKVMQAQYKKWSKGFICPIH